MGDLSISFCVCILHGRHVRACGWLSRYVDWVCLSVRSVSHMRVYMDIARMCVCLSERSEPLYLLSVP